MPISSSIIKPAIPEIVNGAKVAVGITAPGSYYKGNTNEATQYLALLTCGYEAQASISSPESAEKLLSWVYGSNGSGGMKGLKDAPVQTLFTPPAAFFNAPDPMSVLDKVNAMLENVAVPSLGVAAENSIRAIVDSMNPPRDWYSSESDFAKMLVTRARTIVYPFLAVRLLGFLPKVCSWPGYLKLAQLAMTTAEEALGAGNAAIPKAAAFLVQCSTLKELGEMGEYRIFPVDLARVQPTMDAFKKFVGTGNPAAVDKLKAYLESGYSNMDFGSIADAWNAVEAVPEEAPAAAAEATPAENSQVPPDAPRTAPENAPGKPAAVTGEDRQPTNPEPAETNPNMMPSGLDRRAYTLLQRMSVDEDQLMQALDYVTSGKYYGTPFLTTYQPGITERAIIKLLDSHTDKASHRHLTGDEADPRERKTIMIPPAFKVDQSQAIWTKAVVTDLGFPFINFTSPPIMELIRGTDPKSIKAAYRQVKGMFKRCKLKKPIDTLKEFAHAQYRNCALNSLVVDADTIFNVEPGQSMTVSIVDPYNPKLNTKGSFGLPLDFATAFYGILSPVKASRQYAELCGMTPAEYTDYLADHGKPPVYVLTPKRAAFKRGPRGGLLHELFSSKTKPILVRSRVGNHDGGFLIPERIADLLFSM